MLYLNGNSEVQAAVSGGLFSSELEHFVVIGDDTVWGDRGDDTVFGGDGQDYFFAPNRFIKPVL